MFDNRRKKIVPRLYKDIQHSSGRINLSNNLIANFLFERLEDDRIVNHATGSNSLDNLKFIDDSFNPVEPAVDALEIKYSDGRPSAFVDDWIGNVTWQTKFTPVDKVSSIKKQKKSVLLKDTPFSKKIETIDGKQVQTSYYFQYQPEGFHSSILSRYNGRSASLSGKKLSSYVFKILKSNFSELENVLDKSILTMNRVISNGSTITTKFRITKFEENEAPSKVSINFTSNYRERNRRYSLADANGNRGSFDLILRNFKPGEEKVIFRVDSQSLSAGEREIDGTTYHIIPNASYDLTKAFYYTPVDSNQDLLVYSKQANLSAWIELGPSQPTLLGGNYSGNLNYLGQEEDFTDIGPVHGFHELYSSPYIDPSSENLVSTSTRNYNHVTFDGVNDYVAMGEMSDFTNFFGADSRTATISFWIYPEQSANFDPNYSRTIISLSDGLFEIGITDAPQNNSVLRVKATYAAAGGVGTTIPLSLVYTNNFATVRKNQWSHVTVQFSLNNAINGTAQNLTQLAHAPRVWIHRADGTKRYNKEVGSQNNPVTLNIVGEFRINEPIANMDTDYNSISDAVHGYQSMPYYTESNRRNYIGASVDYEVQRPAQPTLHSFFKGKVSEIAIWNTALSSTTFNNNGNVTTLADFLSVDDDQILALQSAYIYRMAETLNDLVAILADKINSKTNYIKAAVPARNLLANLFIDPALDEQRIEYSTRNLTLDIEQEWDLDTKTGGQEPTGQRVIEVGNPEPFRNLVCISPSALSLGLVSITPSLNSVFFKLLTSDYSGNIDFEGKKLEIVDALFNKVVFEFTKDSALVTSANEITSHVYVYLPVATGEWGIALHDNLENKIRANILSTAPNTLEIESDYSYTDSDGGSQSLRGTISHDGFGISLISKISSFTDILFMGTQPSDYEDFSFILEDYDGNKHFYNYYTENPNIPLTDFYIYRDIKIDDQTRQAWGNANISGYAGMGEVEKIRSVVASLTSEAINQNGATQPRATARISALDTETIASNLSFVLSDGTNSVTFSINENSSDATRVDATNYTIGIQGISDDIDRPTDLIKRVYDSIALAKYNSDIDITASNPSSTSGAYAEINPDYALNYIDLTQDNPGAAGNTQISHLNNSNVFDFINFTNGDSHVCIADSASETRYGIIARVQYDGSTFTASLHEDSNPVGYSAFPHGSPHYIFFGAGQLGRGSSAFTLLMRVMQDANGAYYTFTDDLGNASQPVFQPKFRSVVGLTQDAIRIIDKEASTSPGIGLQLDENRNFSGDFGSSISETNISVNRFSSSAKFEAPLDIRLLESNDSESSHIIFSNSPGEFSPRSRNIPRSGEEFIVGTYDGESYIESGDPIIGSYCVRYTQGQELSFFENLKTAVLINSVLANYSAAITGHAMTFEETSEYDFVNKVNNEFYEFGFFNGTGIDLIGPTNEAYYIKDRLLETNSPAIAPTPGSAFVYPLYKNKSNAISASSESIAYYAEFLNYDQPLYFAKDSLKLEQYAPENYNDIKDYEYIIFKDPENNHHGENGVPLSLEKSKEHSSKYSLLSMSSDGIKNTGISKTIMVRIKTPAVGSDVAGSETGTIFTLASSSRCRYQLLVEEKRFKFRAYPESSISGNSQIDVKFEAAIGGPQENLQKDKWYTLFISFKETAFDSSSSSNHYFVAYDSENHGGKVAHGSFSDANGDTTGNILEDLNEDPMLSVGYGDVNQGTITKTQAGKTDPSKYYSNFKIAEIGIFDKNLTEEECSKIAESHTQFRTKSGFQNELPKILLKKITNQEIFKKDSIFKEGVQEVDLELKSQKISYPEMQPAGSTGSIKFSFTSRPDNDSAISFRLPDGSDFQVVAKNQSTIRNGFKSPDSSPANVVDANGLFTPIINSDKNPIEFGVSDLENASIREVCKAFVDLINNSKRYLRIPIKATLNSNESSSNRHFVSINYLNTGASDTLYQNSDLLLVSSGFNITGINGAGSPEVSLKNKVKSISKYRFKNPTEENILKIGSDQVSSEINASIVCNISNLQSYLDNASIDAEYISGINNNLPTAHPSRVNSELSIDLSLEGLSTSYRDENIPLKPVLKFSINGIEYNARLDITRNFRESNRYNICTGGILNSSQLAFAVSTSILDAIEKDNLQLSAPTITESTVNITPLSGESYISDVTFDGYGLRSLNGSENNLFSITNFPPTLNPTIVRSIQSQNILEVDKISPFVDDDRVDLESNFFSSGISFSGETGEDFRVTMRTADKVRIEIDINPSTSTTLGLTTGSIGVDGQTEIKDGYQTGTFNPMGYFNFASKKWESITPDTYTPKIETNYLDASIEGNGFNLPSPRSNPGGIKSFVDNVEILGYFEKSYSTKTKNVEPTHQDKIVDPTRGDGVKIISQRGKDLSISQLAVQQIGHGTPPTWDVPEGGDGKAYVRAGTVIHRTIAGSGFAPGDKIKIPASMVFERTLNLEFFSLIYTGESTGQSIRFYRDNNDDNLLSVKVSNAHAIWRITAGQNVTIGDFIKIMQHDYEGFGTADYFSTIKNESNNKPKATLSFRNTDLERLDYTEYGTSAAYDESIGDIRVKIDSPDGQGGINSVLFRGRTTGTTPFRSGPTLYYVGLQDANQGGNNDVLTLTRAAVAKRFYDAIKRAIDEGDLTNITVLDPSDSPTNPGSPNEDFDRVHIFATEGPTYHQDYKISGHGISQRPYCGEFLSITPFHMPFAWPHNIHITLDLGHFAEFVKNKFVLLESDFIKNHPDARNLPLKETSVKQFWDRTYAPRTQYFNGISFVGPPGTSNISIRDMNHADAPSYPQAMRAVQPILLFQRIGMDFPDSFEKIPKGYHIYVYPTVNNNYPNLGDLIQAINDRQDPTGVTIEGAAALSEMRKECRIVVTANASQVMVGNEDMPYWAFYNDPQDFDTHYNDNPTASDFVNSPYYSLDDFFYDWGDTTTFRYNGRYLPGTATGDGSYENNAIHGATLDFTVSEIWDPTPTTTRAESIKSALELFHSNTPVGFGGTYGFSIHREDVFSNASMKLTAQVSNLPINASIDDTQQFEIPLTEDEKYYTLTSASGKSAKFYFLESLRKLSPFDLEMYDHLYDHVDEIYTHLGNFYLPQFIFYKRKTGGWQPNFEDYRGVRIEVTEQDLTLGSNIKHGIIIELHAPNLSDPESDRFFTIKIINDTDATTYPFSQDGSYYPNIQQCRLSDLFQAFNGNIDVKRNSHNTVDIWTLKDYTDGVFQRMYGVKVNNLDTNQDAWPDDYYPYPWETGANYDPDYGGGTAPVVLRNQESALTVPYQPNMPIRTLMKNIYSAANMSVIGEEMIISIFPPIPDPDYHVIYSNPITAIPNPLPREDTGPYSSADNINVYTTNDNEDVAGPTEIVFTQKVKGVSGNTNLFNYFDHGRQFKITVDISDMNQGLGYTDSRVFFKNIISTLIHFKDNATFDSSGELEQQFAYDGPDFRNGFPGVKIDERGIPVLQFLGLNSASKAYGTRFEESFFTVVDESDPVSPSRKDDQLDIASDEAFWTMSRNEAGTWGADTEGTIRINNWKHLDALRFTGGKLGDKITFGAFRDNHSSNTDYINRVTISCAINGIGQPHIPFRSFPENFGKLTRNIVINSGEAYGSENNTHFIGGILSQDPNREEEAATRQFLELPMRGRPISNFGFPFSKTYKPSEGQKLNLSEYLDGPFLLEKFEIICSASIKDEVSEGFGRVLPKTPQELPFASFGKIKEDSVDSVSISYPNNQDYEHVSSRLDSLPTYSYDALNSAESTSFYFHSLTQKNYKPTSTLNKTYQGIYDGTYRLPFAQKMYDEYFFSTISSGSVEIKNLFSIDNEIGFYSKSRMEKEFYFRASGDSYNNPYGVKHNIREGIEYAESSTITSTFLVKRLSDSTLNGPAESFSNTEFTYNAATGVWDAVTKDITISRDGGFSVGDKLYFAPLHQNTAGVQYTVQQNLTQGFTLEVTEVNAGPDINGVTNWINSAGKIEYLNASAKGGSAWWRCDTFFLLREKKNSIENFSIELPKKLNSQESNVKIFLEEDLITAKTSGAQLKIGHTPGPLDKEGSSFTYFTSKKSLERKVDGMYYPVPADSMLPELMFGGGNTDFAETSWLIGDENAGNSRIQRGYAPQLELRNDSSSVGIVFYNDTSDSALVCKILRVPVLKEKFIDDDDNNTIVGTWGPVQGWAYSLESPYEYQRDRVVRNLQHQQRYRSNGQEIRVDINYTISSDPNTPIQWVPDPLTATGGFKVGELIRIYTPPNTSTAPTTQNGGVNDSSASQEIDSLGTILLRVTSVALTTPTDVNVGEVMAPTALEFAGHLNLGKEYELTIGDQHTLIPDDSPLKDIDNNGQYQSLYRTDIEMVQFNPALQGNVDSVRRENMKSWTFGIPRELVLNYILVNIAKFRDSVDSDPDSENSGRVTYTTNESTPGFEGLITDVNVKLHSTFAFQKALMYATELAVQNLFLGDPDDLKCSLPDEKNSILTIEKSFAKPENSLFGITGFSCSRYNETIFPESTFLLEGVTTQYNPPYDSTDWEFFQNNWLNIREITGVVENLTGSIVDKSSSENQVYHNIQQFYSSQKISNSIFFPISAGSVIPKDPSHAVYDLPVNEYFPTFSINILSNALEKVEKGYTTRELVSYSQVAYYGYAQSNSTRARSNVDTSAAYTALYTGSYPLLGGDATRPQYICNYYFVDNPGQLFYFDNGRKKSMIHPHRDIFGSFESLSITNNRNLLQNGLGRDLNIKITSLNSSETLFEDSPVNEPSLFESIKDIKSSIPKISYLDHASRNFIFDPVLATDGQTPVKVLKEITNVFRAAPGSPLKTQRSFIDSFSPISKLENVHNVRFDSSSTNAMKLLKNYCNNVDITDNLYSGVLRVQSDCKNTDRINVSFPYTLNIVDQYDNWDQSFLPQIISVTIGSTYIGGADIDGLGGANYYFTSLGDSPSGENFRIMDLPKIQSIYERNNPKLEVIENSFDEDSAISPGTNFARNNPYLLNPEDNIILGFQSALPGFETGYSSVLNLGGGNVPKELDDYGSTNTLRTRGINSTESLSNSLTTGRCIETTFSPYENSKLVLYGSYLRNNLPVRNSKKLTGQNSVFINMDKDGIFDQYDLQTDSEFIGSRLGELRSKTTIRVNPELIHKETNLLPVTQDSSLPADQIIFEWSDLTNSITGSDDQSVSGVKKLFASGSVNRYIFLHDADKSFGSTSTDPGICHDMIYYDSLPPKLSFYVNQVREGNNLSKLVPYEYAQQEGMHVQNANGNTVYGIRQSSNTAVLLIGAPLHTGITDSDPDPKTVEGIPKSVHDKVYDTEWRGKFLFEPFKNADGEIIEPADFRERSYEFNFGLDIQSFNLDGTYDISSGLIVAQSLKTAKQIIVIDKNASILPHIPAANFIGSQFYDPANLSTHSIKGFSSTGLIFASAYPSALFLTGAYISETKAPITLSSFVNQVDNNSIKQTAAILFGFGRTPNRDLETLSKFTEHDGNATPAHDRAMDSLMLGDTDAGTGFIYTEEDGTDDVFRVAQQNPTQVLAHPRGVKYGMMNYAALRPKIVFNRRHFGYFSDLVAGRPYAAFSLPVGASENVLEGFEIHEQHGATTPIEAKFFDSARNRIKQDPSVFNDVKRFLFSQNLDRFQRSGVPFFDFDEDIDGGLGGRVRSSADIRPEEISLFRANEDVIDIT